MNNVVYLLIFGAFIVLIFLCLLNGKKVKVKYKIILNLILIFLLIILTGYIIKLSTIKPNLSINGDKIVTVNVFDKYIDQGYNLTHANKNTKVITSNEVNTNVIGIYDVKYSVKIHKKNLSVTRKVRVVDEEKPIIKLKGEKEITLVQGLEYKEPGFTAEDNYDGDITREVVVTNNIKDEVGEYEVIYTVKDSSENIYSIKRKVNRVAGNNGVIYLTFDDGPSSITPKVLDILKNENIKATFFVVNYSQAYEGIVKRIIEEGHTIGLHSYTHKYNLIYSSEESYFNDLEKLRTRVKITTGVDSNIIRFPGGSSNTISRFNKGIMTRLVKMVKENGYHYFDWNVDSGDAGGARNSTDVYNNVINNLNIKRNNVVLMHDLGNNIKTLNALESIIKDAKAKGYSFDKITYDTPMVVHGVNN